MRYTRTLGLLGRGYELVQRKLDGFLVVQLHTQYQKPVHRVRDGIGTLGRDQQNWPAHCGSCAKLEQNPGSLCLGGHDADDEVCLGQLFV